jgi:hypothetical protein
LTKTFNFRHKKASGYKLNKEEEEEEEEEEE